MITPEQLLLDDAFVSIWGEYLSWRKLKGKRYPVTDRVIRYGLEALAEMGSVEAAIKSLKHCMVAQYKGIFPAPVIRQPAPAFGQIPDAPARAPQRPASPTFVPRHTPQEELALAEYKKMAEEMNASDRSDLLTKARDTLPPHLVGQLSARISILNAQKKRGAGSMERGAGNVFVTTEKNAKASEP